MSDPGAAPPAAPAFIDLKVLSPSTEVDADMFFVKLPASTTVAELKLKIKDQIATKPAVERMRLIYRGRVMAKESDTMTDVFGRDEIRASSEQSLHLVLRESNHSSHPHNASSTSSTPIPRNPIAPTPRASTVPPPNPFRTGPPSPAIGGPTPPPQTNPFRAPALGRQPPLPQQAHQNHVPHVHHHHHNQFPHLHPFPFALNGQQTPPPHLPPHLPIPPELQNLLQQQAQAGGQPAHNHAAPPQNGQTLAEQQNGATDSAAQTNTREGAARNAFQDYVARQQQQRAASRSPGVGAIGANGANPPGENREPANGPPPALPYGHLPPNSSSTIRHEGIGPNGQRWTMTVNSTNVTTGPGHQPPNLGRVFPHPPHMPLPQFMNGRTGTPPGNPSPSLFNNGPTRLPYQNMDRDLARIRASLQGAQREMENIRLLINTGSGELIVNGTSTGTAVPTWRHSTIRQHMQSLLANLDQLQTGLNSLVADPELARNRDIVSLQILNNSLRQQADGLVESIDRLQQNNAESARAATPNGSSNSSAPPTSTQPNPSQPRNQPQHPAATQTTVQPQPTAPGPELFLLSGPQGPVGLLFDERGTYTTAPFAPTLPFDTFNQQFNANRQVLAGFVQQVAQTYQQPAANAAQAPNQQPINAGRNAGAQPGQPAAPQAQGGQRPQAQVIGLGAIATHFWLLFKLLAFIYLFAGGSGWRRPVMMGITGIVVYLAQLGLFENHFDRVRRHFEALLPIAEREVGNRQPGRAEGAQGGDPRRVPTPEEAAQRLMREHEERERGWLRERVRMVERAVALFVASLWPGLGERMVRAREERVAAERREEERIAAEEQAQREAREKEEAEKADAEKAVVEAGEAGEGASGSRKGKEKAVVPEGSEASGSGAVPLGDEGLVQ